ncbi:MAG: ribonuclease HII [Clostridiales bacterium]|nr:ribonuclease HII [Clostridiales bacterium]
MNKDERQKMLLHKLQEMKAYEEALYSKGIRYIAGVDEVGRGPLAGPLVAAAVILPEDFNILGINDSKKLTENKREELNFKIKDNCLAYGIGIVDNVVIDNVNILEATKIAMRDAIRNLGRRCCIEHILLDALVLEDVPIPQTSIVKGDSKSISIAAASILAKVIRDRMMVKYHQSFPYYSFDTNKGYGTKAHYEGIKQQGICSIHRKSFLKNILTNSGL